jgi:hypothetical protein
MLGRTVRLALEFWNEPMTTDSAGSFKYTVYKEEQTNLKFYSDFLDAARTGDKRAAVLALNFAARFCGEENAGNSGFSAKLGGVVSVFSLFSARQVLSG